MVAEKKCAVRIDVPEGTEGSAGNDLHAIFCHFLETDNAGIFSMNSVIVMDVRWSL